MTLVHNADGAIVAVITHRTEGTVEISLGVDAYQSTVLTAEQAAALVAAIKQEI